MNYKKLLTEELLPKWIEISVDKECGGVFTSFDENHNPKTDTGKHVWFCGRGMWTYSLAYLLCGPKKEYLDICEHIFAFLKQCTFPDGKLPQLVERDGEPKLIKNIFYYTEMFAAMGCAQYYRICKREDVKAQAELYFNYIYEQYMANLNTNQEEDYRVECKTFGLHMAMLAAAQFVRNAGIEYKKADNAALTAIEQMQNGGFVDDKNRCIHEHVTLEGALFDNEVNNSSCPGHIYEAAWFVMSEGEYRNDDKIRRFGVKLTDYAMPEGFDKITDVIPTVFDLSKSVAENVESGKFLNWPQLEAVTAFLLAYKITGEERYRELSEKFEKMTFSYFESFEDTIWCREIYKEDGRFVSSRGNGYHINGPFHIERVLLALGTVAETGSILEYVK